MRTRARLVSLAAFAFIALSAPGCAPGAIGGDGDGVGDSGGDDGDDPFDPNDPDTPDPAACVGDGTEGAACEVTADCTAPTVCVNGFCIGPDDPEFRCDPIEGVYCETDGELCVAGVCVLDPLVPGDDTCPVPGPGPDLSGTWQMSSTLHLREGLPGLAAGFLSASETLADWIEGNIDLGLPAPVELLLGSLVEAIIDKYVPEWAQEMVVMLAGFSDVLDNLQIDQTVVLTGQPCDATYRGSSTWDRITFEYRGVVISERPEDIAEIGPVSPEDFGARFSCGSLYIDQHRVHNALRGLVRWMVDTMVEITTGYPTLELAIDAAFDCVAIANAINDSWQSACGCSTDISAGIEATCTGFKADLMADLTTLIDEAAIEMSVVSLEGLATIPDANRMLDGSWYGQLVSRQFPGSFHAQK